MLPYVGVILVVYLIAVFVEKSPKYKYGILGCILIILIMSIFAGVRNEDIGTDVLVYVKPVYETMKNNTNMLRTMRTVDMELIFFIITFITSLLNGSLNLLLFLLQLVISIFIVLFAYSHKKEISFSMCMLAYMGIFYGLAFNIVRQCIAMAIALYAFRYVEKKDFKKFMLYIILATLSHITALICIPLYFFYWHTENNKRGLFIKYVILCLIIFMIFRIKTIYFDRD